MTERGNPEQSLGYATGRYHVPTQGDEGSVPMGEPEAVEDHGDGPKLRTVLTVGWVVGVVAFTLARFVVARETLMDYGLNIWVFGFIDLITAVPYALGTAQIVGALVDREPARASKWAVVAAASFLAPYAYVAWAGRDASFPTIVWIVLAALIVLFGGNAIRGVRRKVREGRGAPAFSG